MRQIIRKVGLACVLLFAICRLAPAALLSETFSGKCIGVTDGDTIKVLRSGQETKIRLEGIDCPESGEPFSAKAKKLTSSLAFGKTFTVSRFEERNDGPCGSWDLLHNCRETCPHWGCC